MKLYHSYDLVNIFSSPEMLITSQPLPASVVARINYKSPGVPRLSELR